MPVVDIISVLFEQLVFTQLQEFRGTIKAKTSVVIKKEYRAHRNRMYRQTSTSLPSREKLVKLKVPYCFVNADFIIYLRTLVCYHSVMIFNDSRMYVFFIFYTAILTDSIANYRCPSYPLSRPYLTNAGFSVTVKNTGEVWEIVFKERERLKMDFSIVSCKRVVRTGLHKETKRGGTPHRTLGWWQQTVPQVQTEQGNGWVQFGTQDCRQHRCKGHPGVRASRPATYSTA